MLKIVPSLLGKVEFKCSVLEHHRQNKHHIAGRILQLNDITSQLARQRGRSKSYQDIRDRPALQSRLTSGIKLVSTEEEETRVAGPAVLPLGNSLDVVINKESKTKSKIVLEV